MVLQQVNLAEKLIIEKKKQMKDGLIHPILQDSIPKNQHPHINHEKSKNTFNFDLLASENIYHIQHIEQLCIRYRLRFLNSNLYKGEIPKEALLKIQHLEIAHNTYLNNLKLMAPSKVFRLKSKDDPILFVPMGNNYYYLIHKWGNDLHPLRKLYVFPIKNYINLLISIIVLSFIITLLIPISIFTKSPKESYFLILLLFNFKGILALTFFYSFVTGKNVNKAIWRTNYYN